MPRLVRTFSLGARVMLEHSFRTACAMPHILFHTHNHTHPQAEPGARRPSRFRALGSGNRELIPAYILPLLNGPADYLSATRQKYGVIIDIFATGAKAVPTS